MKTKWYETLSALCAAAVLLAGVCACKGTADTEYVYVEKQSDDVTAPNEVSGLAAANKDASALLTWTDAADADVYGYEVSWNGTGAINRAATSTAVASGSMIVAQGAGGCYISNLVNGTSYTFTVKSVDTNGNRSAGVTAEITPAIIEAGPLTISCKADVTAATSGNVTVTVDAATDNASALKTVAYRNGTVRTAAELFALGAYSDANTGGYTVVTPDTDGAYTFTVEANGTFTAAALDTAGREECAYITVSNIDKNAGIRISAGYSSSGGKLSISWIKPDALAVDHYSYVCTDTTASAVLSSSDAVTETAVTIDGITQGHTYTVTVCAFDVAGNKSSAAEKTIKAEDTVCFDSIIIYRTNYTGHVESAKTHLDEWMTDRSMTVVLKGSNLSKVTGLAVRSRCSETGAVQDITVPASSSDTQNVYTFDAPYYLGSYTVYPYTDHDGAVGTVTASYMITESVDVSGLTLETEKFVKGISGRMVQVYVQGSNLDLLDVRTVKVFDASRTQVGNTVTIDEEQSSPTMLTAQVPVPETEGHYKVYLINYYGTCCSLWVYGETAVTDVTVPLCGTARTSETVPVSITGSTLAGVSANTITVKCGDSYSETAAITDADHAVAAIPIPSAVGSYPVSVFLNGAHVKTATLTVMDDKNYKNGDVILDAAAQKPVAVLYYTRYGAPFVVGLNGSKREAWAKSDTTGYTMYFTKIQSKAIGRYSDYVFSGDADGSDNWSEICKADTAASATAAENYPAFNYANTYGATYCDGTAFTEGWYMPSLSELYELYKCKKAVNEGLACAGGTKIPYGNILSSSQFFDKEVEAVSVDFTDGIVRDYDKSCGMYVRVIRAVTDITSLTRATPTATAVSIPACSTTGGTVPVTVNGSYLCGSAEVTVTCNGTDYNAVLYGSYAVATVAIPATAGSYPVTVKANGTPQTASGTLVCKEYDSATYALGSIICSDGSVVTKDKYNSTTMTAVAVICGGTNVGGAPLAVGLSQGNSQWAPYSTTGCKTNFAATVCTPSGSNASTATFTGDTYGGDNWDAVCAVDGTASANAAENYPVFNYANTYTATNCTSGWYIPSIRELCTLYMNKDTINESLNAVKGELIGTGRYWSSSQYSINNEDAWNVNFNDGYAVNLYKVNGGYVRVIRAF